MVGKLLIGAGVGLMALAFFMNVSFPDPSGQYAEGIANNDLLNQRLLMAVAGSAAFIGGWLSLVRDAIRRLNADRAATESPPQM